MCFLQTGRACAGFSMLSKCVHLPAVVSPFLGSVHLPVASSIVSLLVLCPLLPSSSTCLCLRFCFHFCSPQPQQKAVGFRSLEFWGRHSDCSTSVSRSAGFYQGSGKLGTLSATCLPCRFHLSPISSWSLCPPAFPLSLLLFSFLLVTGYSLPLVWVLVSVLGVNHC